MRARLPYQYLKATKNSMELSKLERMLFSKGAFDLPITSLNISSKKVLVVRAANTDLWPMGTHYWIRDNALIAERLCRCETFDTKRSRKLRIIGISLLLSCLNIASTPSQLSRMKAIIINTDDNFARNAANWPQIFLGIHENLAGTKHENWAHKQDAWQILAFIVFSLLEDGTLSLSRLNEAQREFLSLIFPFLLRVKYYRQENSGSWEEIEAVRSSVLAWELATLTKISTLAVWPKYAFLKARFKKYQAKLMLPKSEKSFDDCLQKLIRKGALQLKLTIPHECPLYPQDDPRYREADGALIYLLQLNTAQMVAQILNLPDSWIKDSEVSLLKNIKKLFDQRSGGYRRYQNDSYQRLGFFRSETIGRLKEMYGSPSGDVSKHFVGRDTIVPKGPEAAWTHFTWQLSAWAGVRFQKTYDESYFKLQKNFFREGLRTITRTGMTSLSHNKMGTAKAINISAYRFPECYLTEEDSKKNHYIFPTPHTPLNWATAEALSAFSALRRSFHIKNS